jgi:preprotein translocase subunit SecY
MMEAGQQKIGVDADRWRRLATTVVLLLVPYALFSVPLPGMGFSAFQSALKYGGFNRISLGALDVAPLFTAFVYFEICRTLTGSFPERGVSAAASPNVSRWVVAGALVLAGFQAWGYAVGLEAGFGSSADPMVPEPGLTFRIGVVASLVAVTALLAWLAAMITRFGIGSGLWLLLATQTLAAVWDNTDILNKLMKSGAMPVGMVVAICSFYVLVAALLVLLHRARDGSRNPLYLDPWVPVMAVTLMPVVQLLHYRMDPLEAAYLKPLIGPGSWAYAIELTVLVAALCFVRVWRFGVAATGPQRLANALPAAFTYAAICLLLEVAAVRGNAALQSRFALLSAHELIPLILTALAVCSSSRFGEVRR